MGRKKKPFDIDAIIDSYTGTDFQAFCCHVNWKIEEYFPERSRERLERKKSAADIVLNACRRKNIKVPLHQFALATIHDTFFRE